MVVDVTVENTPQAYVEVLHAMRINGEEQNSRNGPVTTIPDPFFLEILNPQERVLFDPTRNANPFFHLMEFVWMMSGSNDVNWIAQFNKRYHQYADGNIVHGAYGFRWINHFHVNQIFKVIHLLKTDRTTRRAVLGMWDPTVDLEPHNDLPCNTHIYFRVEDDALNMTVCNRSNDIIWGMLGANVVHMTLLQELIAHGCGLRLGSYQVMSNNAHIYHNLPNFEEIFNTTVPYDYYSQGRVEAMPLLRKNETVADFLMDCFYLVNGEIEVPRTEWMDSVVYPMYMAWILRKEDKHIESAEQVLKIKSSDWRTACSEWVVRKSASLTLTGR